MTTPILTPEGKPNHSNVLDYLRSELSLLVYFEKVGNTELQYQFVNDRGSKAKIIIDLNPARASYKVYQQGTKCVRNYTNTITKFYTTPYFFRLDSKSKARFGGWGEQLERFLELMAPYFVAYQKEIVPHPEVVFPGFKPKSSIDKNKVYDLELCLNSYFPQRYSIYLDNKPFWGRSYDKVYLPVKSPYYRGNNVLLYDKEGYCTFSVGYGNRITEGNLRNSVYTNIDSYAGLVMPELVVSYCGVECFYGGENQRASLNSIYDIMGQAAHYFETADGNADVIKTAESAINLVTNDDVLNILNYIQETAR